MRHTLFNLAPSDVLKSAIQRYEAGLYHQAGAQFLEILAKEPDNADARFYYRLIERKFVPRPPEKPALIWQFDPSVAWETDWLRLLFGPLIGTETVDNSWSRITNPMIVIDNRLVSEKVSYYREAFETGARIILIHLSDEAFKDDYGAYKYCDAVIRNYYSERLAQYANIHFIPLGYKTGFARERQTLKLAVERRYTWAFAGDGKKLTRADMLSALERVPDGFVHLTSGFGAADALSTDQYRRMMDDAVFAPCPSGWSNLDSFRVYEALEAGCIPIVEQRPHFDYFTMLLGPHPMPTITNWAKAPDLIAGLQRADEVERIREVCTAWWRAYKPRLVQQIEKIVTSVLA